MNEDKLSNFIPINRKIFDHEFWGEDRCFSKFEAWIDLLQSARYDEEIKSEWVNGKEIKFGRGQLIASYRFLLKRWKWGSITKVERFINVLKNKDMVVSEKGQGINVITICKYDTYNQIKKEKRTVKGQVRGQQKDETNKENKEEELFKDGDDCDKFVKYFNKIADREFQATDKVRAMFLCRLKEGYTKKQIALAVKNAHLDKYHIESNFKDLTPYFILRVEKLEKFMNVKPIAPASNFVPA